FSINRLTNSLHYDSNEAVAFVRDWIESNYTEPVLTIVGNMTVVAFTSTNTSCHRAHPLPSPLSFSMLSFVIISSAVTMHSGPTERIQCRGDSSAKAGPPIGPIRLIFGTNAPGL